MANEHDDIDRNGADAAARGLRRGSDQDTADPRVDDRQARARVRGAARPGRPKPSSSAPAARGLAACARRRSRLAYARGDLPARARAIVSTSSSTARRHCRPWRPSSRAPSPSSISTGWFFSPELHLSRDDEPVIVRNLLAELAERVDVRLLSWKGAPVPLFKPSQNDVREMLDGTRPAHEDRGARGRLHGIHALPSREDDRDRRPRCVRRAAST